MPPVSLADIAALLRHFGYTHSAGAIARLYGGERPQRIMDRPHDFPPHTESDVYYDATFALWRRYGASGGGYAIWDARRVADSMGMARELVAEIAALRLARMGDQ
jgi:hypothetical protein